MHRNSRRSLFNKTAAVLAASFIAVMPQAWAAIEARGAWTVGPVSFTASEGEKYCTMKNVYANGHTFVFARDRAGMNSLAVDVATPTFQTGQQYAVLLSSGSAQRSVSALAASERILMINMGYDEAFYATLRQQVELSLTLAGGAPESYSLQGTADALQALDECAVALSRKKPPVTTKKTDEKKQISKKTYKSQPPKVNRAVVDVPSNATAQDVDAHSVGNQAMANVRKEMETLRARTAAQMDENKSLQERLAALERSSSEGSSKAEIQQQQFESNLQDLKRKNDQLQKANDDLKSRLMNLEQTPILKPVTPAEPEVLSAPAAPSFGSFNILDLAPGAENAMSVDPAVQTDVRVYHWTVDGIYGSLEDAPHPPGKPFSGAVNEYLEAMSERCAGDFAHTQNDPQVLKDAIVQPVEMACMDTKNESAAALLFVDRGGRLSLVSYESSPERMAAAVEKRNQLIDSVFEKIR